MDELIKREDAIKATWHEPSYTDQYNVLTEVRDRIEALPTVDAVPVVRCGECKHYKDGMCYNPNTYDDEKTCGNTTADWFCADGERNNSEIPNS